MRLRYINSLLLTTGAVYAHSSGCAEELSKYNTCISSINSNLNNFETEGNIKTMCSKFNSTDCKTFLSDIFLTTTNCDITNDHEKPDALSILNLRIAYLKYCAIDNSGNICPFSRYLTEENENHTHIHDHNEEGHIPKETNVNESHSHEQKQSNEEEHNHEHTNEQNNSHNHNHSTAFTEADIKPRKLSEFNGDYQSVYPYFLEGVLADYVVQQAEKNNNTFAEQRNIINEKWNCGVSYFSVKDNTISFIYENGKKESAEYVPAGFATKKNDKGEISSTRYKFETKSKHAPKYVMLNDHGHEPSAEEITHVHLHFSNKSYDDIMNSKLIPFFVQKRYNSDETREVLLGHDGYDETLYPGEEVSTFDDEDVRDRTLSNWNGEWKSPYKYLLEGKLDEAFEVKAKNKGDKTAAEYKEYYKKGYETDIDSISIKNNEITFTFDNGKSVKAKYQYLGYYIQHWNSGTKAAMYRFENIDKKSKAPRLFEINDHLIKRSKTEHFHLRTTNTKWEDIDAENNWPTFFPKSYTIDDIISELSGVVHSHKTEEKINLNEEHNHEHTNEQNNSHNHNHSTAFTEADIKPRKLSEFNGDYQSVYPYFLEGVLADYVVQQAEKNNNTFAEQRDIIDEKWNCGVSYFSVKDDTISFIYENGKKESAEYVPAGFATKKNDKGEISSTRYKFETKSKHAPKYVMLNDHGHEPSSEEITHVHLHFSNKSYDDIMNSKLIPFFVQKRYNADETREVLLGHDGYDETLYPGEEVSTFDDEDVRDRTLSNWNGEWKSPYKYLLEGKLDEAFEVKAKNKGDKTASEYKEYYKKGYETDIDSISIKNNEITFTFDNGKSVKAKYQYLGYYIQHWNSGTKAAMYRFENIDKKSKAPRLFEINDHLIKRSKTEHFHLRTTNTKWEDIDAENNWPTFFPKSFTIDDIISELSGVVHSHKTEEKEKENAHDHIYEHEDDHTNEQTINNDSADNDSEESSQDENDALVDANKTINSYDGIEVNVHENEHAFYHDLMDDCQILECSKRFVTLVELLKVTGNPEVTEYEEYVKYYQKNNCDALHKLVEVNSGSISIKKISFSFILTIFLFIYFIN